MLLRLLARLEHQQGLINRLFDCDPLAFRTLFFDLVLLGGGQRLEGQGGRSDSEDSEVLLLLLRVGRHLLAASAACLEEAGLELVELDARLF